MVWRLTLSTKQALFLLLPAALATPQGSVPTFGTTVVDSAGFRGEVYAIPEGSERLPDFRRLHSLGSIYTTRLDVPGRSFTEGFPGVTDRTEWFAIDYQANFWVEQPRLFRFALESDDGSKLYVDDRLLIDNDGNHPQSGCIGQAELARGVHRVRVSYFQGSRYHVALLLGLASGDGAWDIFDTRHFRPPADADVQPSAHPIRKVRRSYCWAR